MKKTFLALAVAAVAAVCFTACPGPQEKTTADYLSAPKNGWVLESALCSPAYEMLSGELIGDLVNGYLYDFEKDDIITFTADGVQTIKPGNLLPAEDQDGYTQDVAYLWRIDEQNDGWIFMQVPFFYDEVQEYVHILTLDENQFKFLCTFNDDEQGAKGTYTLTMNYVPAK